MRRCIAAFVFAILTNSVAHAAGPVCALLDPEKVPRAALLEAKLLADANATWVERAGIDAVLKEQKLQALFSPQGVGERVKLGKLLKAELLVLVRSVKGAEVPTLELVVSETTGGLRLMVRAVPVTKDADADVAALLAAVREGVKKHGEKVTEIVAVPPFVSNDLEFTHDHLKGAFAKLAEAEALGRKGVVVVELEEAEALAKEIALAAPGMKIDRPLPVYLFGEYRHDGKGNDRTIALKLRAERGGKGLEKAVELKMKPGAEPEAVRNWAARTLDTLAKDDKPRPPADPKTEAKQLAERARVFARLANWPESLALVEASLLLDPDQTALHGEAIKALSPAVRAAWSKSQSDFAAADRMAVLYRRSLVHLEAFFMHGGDPADYRAPNAPDFVATLRSSPNGLMWGGSPPKRVIEIYEELRKDERETFLRIIPVEARRGKGRESAYLWWAVHHLPAREKYAAVEQVTNDLRALPNPVPRAVAYASLGYAVPPDTPEFRAFLGRLAASDDKSLQQAAGQLRARLEVKLPERPAGVGPGPGGVKFTPVALTFEGQVPTAFRVRAFAGVLAVGEKTDVLWSAEAVYVMKEKGKLRLLWCGTGTDVGLYGFSSVGFDGKYIWATLPRPKGHPLLLVIDPQAEKVWDLSTSEGIPLAPEREGGTRLTKPTVLAAPLEPGRACLAGSFSGRTWIGVAAFDAATGKAAVKIIHEAKDAPDRTDENQWKKTTVAFTPQLAVALAGKAEPGGKPERRVLVGRVVEENARIGESPLVIDPDRGTVEVLNDRAWFGVTQRKAAVIGGAVYLPASGPGGREVVRYALPTLAREVVAQNPSPTTYSETRIAAHDGRFHIVLEEKEKREAGRVIRQYQWVTVGLDGKNPRLIADELASLRGVWASSHYGLVTLIEESGTRRPVLNTVEILEPAPKK